ncbi:MAG: TonB-dependent receptor [bacterium]
MRPILPLLLLLVPLVAVGQEAAPASEAPAAITPPTLVEFIEAPYPAAALEARREAAVVLALTVGVDGAVSDIEVVEPAGDGFDEAAVEAVSRFRFEPARSGGEAIPVRLQYRYAFTLKQVVEEKAAPTGRLEGRLIEAGTRRPLPGLIVRLPALGQEAISDAEGRFAFENLQSGRVLLRVEDPEYADLEDEEDVVEGQATEVRYILERDAFGDTVTVVGRRPRKEVVRRTVSVQEIRTLPGTQGDALKAVQNLPGVARVAPGFDGDRLVLRGGGSSRAYVDRHPVPLAFHFGGIRSTVASALIEDLDLYPGNYGPEFGRVNGGVVDVRLRDPRTDGIHGYAEADVFDAGALVEGPVGDGGLAVAFRRSYIDGVLAVALPESVRRRFSTAPRYYDGQVLYQRKDGPHDLRLLLFGSSDRIIVLSESAQGGFVNEWAGGLGRWRHRIDDDLTHELSASVLCSQENGRFNTDFERNVELCRLTLRDDLSLALAPTLDLRLGIDAELAAGTFLLRSQAGGFPREGEAPPDGPPKANDAEIVEVTEDLLWNTPAVFAELEWRLGKLKLLPSLRLEWFGATEDVALQPRLSARAEVASGTTLKAAVGLYSEQPGPDDLSDRFGNPDLSIERTWQVSAGFEQQLTEALSLDVTGFYKQFQDLATRVDDPSVRLANQGEGRVYGVEVLLRHDLTSRLFGWLAYTWQRSERRDRPGEGYRLFDLDQTHNLTVVAQYRFTPTWEAGLRWRFVSGNPYTPAVGAVVDSDDLTYVRLDGESNSGRLPPYHALDLRLDKHWVFETWRLTTYLEAQNAYNRENVRDIGYSYDYTESESQLDLPIIPSFGVRGEW